MWLLEKNIKELIEHAETQGLKFSDDKLFKLNADFEASLAADTPRIMSVSRGVAEISITGVLTKTPNFFAILFGGGNTTYAEILAAIAAAEGNSDISEIELFIDSPGGHFDGLFDVLGALRAAKKPIKAVVSNLAASAAYAIAAQADGIEAVNIASRFGSIGVAVSFYTSENEVTLTSTEAPKKRPNVKTKEGRADVVEELDALHNIFVEAIAGGRSAATGKNVTQEIVNKNFGRGATFLAETALNVGMIDSISKNLGISSETLIAPIKKSINKKAEVSGMDIIELKTEHPVLYAQVVELGVKKERDRVNAHLVMGEASGDLKTAIKAVEDGDGMTETAKAKYFAAGMKKKDIEARENENVDLDLVVEPVKKTAADTVADVVCEALGYDEGEA